MSPVKKVMGGYKYGKTGKIYKSRGYATRQGRAIIISKARRSGYKIPRKKD